MLLATSDSLQETEKKNKMCLWSNYLTPSLPLKGNFKDKLC